MNVMLEKINDLIMPIKNMFYVDLVRNELNYPSQTKTVLYYFLNTISFVFLFLYLVLIVLDIVWVIRGTVNILEFLLYLLGTPFLIKFTLWLQVTSHGIKKREE
jgi:hypothetical protein